MYIAITTNGKKLENEVSERFESCKYLLIVNMPDLSVNAIENKSDFSEGELARKVIEFDCEAIITGDIEPADFEILSDAAVTRYYGFGFSAENALDLMEKYSLELIRNPERTDSCEGEHNKELEKDHKCDCEGNDE